MHDDIIRDDFSATFQHGDEITVAFQSLHVLYAVRVQAERD
jgi:hypothetical protein